MPATRTFLFLLLIIMSFSSAAASKNEFSFAKLLKSDWVVAESDNFAILTDLKPKYAKQLLIDLEEFRYFVFYKTGQEPLGGTSNLLILAPSKASSMNALGLEKELAGFFFTSEESTFAVANVTGYKGESDEIQSNINILLHEYVHFATERSLKPQNYPLWYSEGLAEYLATYRNYENEIRIGEPGRFVDRFFYLLPQNTIKKHFTSGSVGSNYRLRGIESADLFESRAYAPAIGNEASKSERDKKTYLQLRFYARSIAVTHFLNATKERAEALEVYFSYLKIGVPSKYAFQAAFGITLEELDKQVEDYINGNSVLGWTYKIGESLKFPEFGVSIREVNKGEIDESFLPALTQIAWADEESDLADFRAYIGKSDSSGALISKHLFNQESLRDFTHSKHEESIHLLENDINKNPNNADLLAMIADVYFERASIKSKIFGQKQTKDIESARKNYVKALKIDPYNAMAYAGLGRLALQNEPNSKDYKQGVVAYDSLEALLVQTLVPEYMLKLARLHVKNDNLQAALRAMRKYDQLSQSRYARLYGKFVYEGLEFWGVCQEMPELNNNTLLWRNGSVYKGDIANGLAEGDGTFTHIQGFAVEGAWKQGKIVSGVLKATNGYQYQGTFEDCAMTGNGEVSFPKKAAYSKSEGDYVAGWEHGQIKFTRVDGATESGRYEMEDPIGEFVITKTNGEILKLDRTTLGFKMEVASGEYWIGGLDKQFKPNGLGYCLKTLTEVTKCLYKHGEKQSVI